MHPPLAASNVFCVHNCTSPSNDYAAGSGMQQQQPCRHSYTRISSLLISRRLTRPRVASRYSVRPEGSATACLGVRDFEIHWISRGFRISEWISGFHSGFLDFSLDFWISVWISADRFLKTTLSDSVRDFFCDGPLGSAFQLYFV